MNIISQLKFVILWPSSFNLKNVSQNLQEVINMKLIFPLVRSRLFKHIFIRRFPNKVPLFDALKWKLKIKFTRKLFVFCFWFSRSFLEASRWISIRVCQNKKRKTSSWKFMNFILSVFIFKYFNNFIFTNFVCQFLQGIFSVFYAVELSLKSSNTIS